MKAFSVLKVKKFFSVTLTHDPSDSPDPRYQAMARSTPLEKTKPTHRITQSLRANSKYKLSPLLINKRCQFLKKSWIKAKRNLEYTGKQKISQSSLNKCLKSGELCSKLGCKLKVYTSQCAWKTVPKYSKQGELFQKIYLFKTENILKFALYGFINLRLHIYILLIPIHGGKNLTTQSSLTKLKTTELQISIINSFSRQQISQSPKNCPNFTNI
ncbi:hypothetical protein EGR_06129 [Echinococcus granulosus]|uniref:Uncharacterized protein n=1 Tax=Echinococcus granulosus TaxID=6210 RepID=W6UDD7_ECHGR|nr:hypothetical protein EGR_06129 [Echinococcus granulosus]EUB59013.1 hypothetical protein EGR_06129 [Echinococcus granulosus]